MSGFLIGIGGISSSGKSTLASKLKERLILHPNATHVILISQDDFYKIHDTNQIPRVDGVEDWDCPDALRLDDFQKCLAEVKTHPNLYCEYCKNGQTIDNTEKGKLI